MGQICEKVARVKNFYGMLLHYAANVRINQISNTFS
jgi:hypothetical protein